MGFNEVRLAIAEFLNFEIYNKGIFYFNLWSVIHMISGGLLMAGLIMVGARGYWKYLILAGLLVLWEVFELVFALNGVFFRLESVKDVIWDIVLALIVGAIVDLSFWISRM